MQNLVVTILAAGEGKRMRSSLPKVLHLCNEVPMLVKVIQTAILLNPKNILVVTGKHHDLIKETVAQYIHDSHIQYVIQETQLGTGDAIKYCLPHYAPNQNVLILSGDVPLITAELLEGFVRTSSQCSILVANVENPHGYGRILLDENRQEIMQIVEEKDCIEEERQVSIINSGIYFIQSKLLREFIPFLENKNAQGEYYLTDIVKLIKNNKDINIVPHLIDTKDNRYILGVNTPEELKCLEELENQ